MKYFFQTDNDPIDRRRLPPVAGTVLAHRLVDVRRRPPFPGLAALFAGVPAAAIGGAAMSGILGLDSWGTTGRLALAGASAVPLGAVLGTYIWKRLFAPPLGWPPLVERFRTWEGLVTALKDSPHEVQFRGETVRERDHLFTGVISGGSKPFLLNNVYLERPAIIVGGTGAGKTKLVAEPLLAQAIRRGDRHIVALVLKHDPAFFYGLAIEAARARQNFKWFTIISEQSSYVWNPFLDPAVARLSREQFIQIVLKALALVTGHEFGEGYFGAMQEERLRRTLERNRVRSFRELYDVMRDQRPGDIGMSERDFSNTGHLVANFARIASIGPLNVVGGDDAPETAIRGAITIREMLSRPGVTYFQLPALLEPTTALFVGKLMIHLSIAAAQIHAGPRVPKLVFSDEFQELIGPDLSTPLRQARESMCTYWTGFQNLSALQTQQGDFVSTILANAALKIFCSTDDLIGREYLTQVSGETRRILESVGETTTATPNGATQGVGHQYREEAVPRLDAEEINQANRDPLSFIAIASQGAGFTHYRFPTRVRTVFHVSRAEYERRKARPWPQGNQYTVTSDAVARVGEPDRPTQARPAPVAPLPPPSPDAVQAEAREPVAPRVTQDPPPQPRRRGRPPRRDRQQAEEPRLPAAVVGEAGEMAEYLRRLALDVKAEDQVVVEEDA
jgi:hypothetical protein